MYKELAVNERSGNMVSVRPVVVTENRPVHEEMSSEKICPS